MSLYLWYIEIVSKYIFEFKTLNVILKFSNIKAISKKCYQYIEKKMENLIMNKQLSMQTIYRILFFHK